MLDTGLQRMRGGALSTLMVLASPSLKHFKSAFQAVTAVSQVKPGKHRLSLSVSGKASHEGYCQMCCPGCSSIRGRSLQNPPNADLGSESFLSM